MQRKIFATFVLFLFGVIACSTSHQNNQRLTITVVSAIIHSITPTPNPTTTQAPTITNTSTPSFTPTQIPSATTTPALVHHSGILFFDMNNSGEQDLEGEIVLSGIQLETVVKGAPYLAMSGQDGRFEFVFPGGTSVNELEIKFANPESLINPANGHLLNTAILNYGQEKVKIHENLVNMLGMTAYVRNKIDLFRANLPFTVPIAQLGSIGLSHGEVTYWIPEWGLDETCIYNYMDVDTSWNGVENYRGENTQSGQWNGPAHTTKWCADLDGTRGQHAVIDTAFFAESNRIIISPVLGVVVEVAEKGTYILTKFGGLVLLGHTDNIKTVETGQIVYPGDILGTGGSLLGKFRRHVHFDYNVLLADHLLLVPNKFDMNPDVNLESAMEFLKSFQAANIKFSQMTSEHVGKLNFLHHFTRPVKIDAFWYEKLWIQPNLSELNDIEGCLGSKYCLTFYRGYGTGWGSIDYVLHPSSGLFAAGNNAGLVIPAENFTEYVE